MKFVDTKRFSPVIYEGDIPDKDDYFHLRPDQVTKEFLKKGNYFIDEVWWMKQEDRCRNGYVVKDAITKGGDMLLDGIECKWYPDGSCYIPLYDLLIKNRDVYISGRHYFYLNFWPIYGKKKGSIGKGLVTPRFLGLDYFFAHRIEAMIEREMDIQELKGRQIGASEKGAGMVIGYNYTFFADSLNLIIGGESTDAEHTMERTITGLDNLANTQFYKERARGGDAKDHIKAKNFGSEIQALTAKDKPQTASRFSPFWVWYEEIGKGKKGWSLDVAKYIEPSIETEGEKTGWQHFIGTAGEMQDGIYDLELRHYYPERHNILSYTNVFEAEVLGDSGKVGHFIGKDWYYFVDADGNPERQKSRKDLLTRRGEKTPEDRYKFITQFPIYASEAFLTTTVGFFGETIVQMLNARKRRIQTDRGLQITKRGRLEFKKDGDYMAGFDFIPDEEEGWLEIVEEPEMEEENKPYLNLYKGGLDSYDQDEALTSNSKGALYIKKGFNPFIEDSVPNIYVAELVERPKTEDGGAEKFYKHAAMTAAWYGCWGSLNIEYSNLRIFQWITDNGLEGLLKERPEMAFAGKILNSQVSNRYGTDKSLKPHILAITKDRMTEEAIEKMFFIRQISSLSRFRYDPTGKKYNCDITIATAETEVAMKEDELLPTRKRKKEHQKKSSLPVYKRMADGGLKLNVG